MEEARDDLAREVEKLSARVSELSEEVKERETSFLRSLKTLAGDYAKYRSGERDFPQAAVLGSIFSYLRPRVAIAVAGGVLASVFTIAQVWLLWNQNQLLEQQNRAIDLQATSFMMSLLDGEDPAKSAIAVSQLSEYGQPGFLALNKLASTQTSVAIQARKVVAEQIPELGYEEFLEVVDSLPLWTLDVEEPEDSHAMIVNLRTHKAIYERITNDGFVRQNVGAGVKSEGERGERLFRGLISAKASTDGFFLILQEREFIGFGAPPFGSLSSIIEGDKEEVKALCSLLNLDRLKLDTLDVIYTYSLEPRPAYVSRRYKYRSSRISSDSLNSHFAEVR